MSNYNYPKQYLYKQVVQAKLFIDAHFDESIDLSNISSEATFSKFHFIRLFKKIFGQTPHQYLIQVRIGQAKKDLLEGRSVTETCYSWVSIVSLLFQECLRKELE